MRDSAGRSHIDWLRTQPPGPRPCGVTRCERNWRQATGVGFARRPVVGCVTIHSERPVKSHKPRTPHSLREFVSEVAVVLLGIVLALAGKRALGSLELRHKIRVVGGEMRSEISGDDGPQVLERIAVSPCINRALDGIRATVEQSAARPAVLEAVGRFATPRHTWDSIAFQAALSAGVLAQLRVDRVMRCRGSIP